MEKSNPLVSVIVPVYKVEKYLNRCVDSIINQTYKNLEIILVDDGSPDNCPSICDEYAKKDKRVKVIHKANGGLMAAWIDGLKQCYGYYVCFVDSDDWVDNSYVEDLYAGLVKYNADVCVCDFMFEYEDKTIRSRQYDENMVFEVGEEYPNLIVLFNKLFPCRWNKIYKRELLLSGIKYCNTKISMGEDVNLNYYVFGNIKKLSYVNKSLVHYNQQNVSSLEHETRDRFQEYKLLVNQLNLINQKERFNAEELTYNIFVLSFIVRCLKFYVWNNDNNKIKELLQDDLVLQFVEYYNPKSIKEKVFVWMLKHKRVKLIKLYYKMLRK